VGISPEHPASFQKYLRERFVNKVNLGKYHLIDGQADPAETIRELTALIAERPIDLGLIGIGENGHIAFNDPPVADFNDKKAVKPVALDEICRNQQVNDGCFAKIEDVPTTAITLTVPTLFAGDYLFCIVPAKTKANAVYATINNEINEKCPATVLRLHKNAILYLDGDSSALL
jgi:glucosamine-6-phosphate deaminase